MSMPHVVTTSLLTLTLALAAGLAAPTRADGPEGFVLRTGRADVDGAYRKALANIAADVREGKFMAGESWDQVWTRDTSYSVELACALLLPDVSKRTLLGLGEDVPGIGECWYQDKCGHFGGWPNLTDAIVGAGGAWSLYVVTGDESLLAPTYERTVNSLRRAERDAFKSEFGLFGGCSTFMESNSGYPKRYENNGALLAKSCALSTNLLYFRGYRVAANVGKKLGKESKSFEDKAEVLGKAIRERLWQPDKGYYAYYIDEAGKPDTRMEGTGEAFAILYGLCDNDQARTILTHTPTTEHGFPCLWPQYPEWQSYKRDQYHYYHNGMIWPFVQGYWAWAAAGMKDEATFARELDALVKLSERAPTFMEYYHPEDGKPDGSARQLWSASGYVSMILHGLFGMEFTDIGIAFAPVVPAGLGELTLSDVRYRDAVLKITVKGHGTRVESFKLDGEPRTSYRVPASLKGPHAIEIVLAADGRN
jgi:hypothetical protein